MWFLFIMECQTGSLSIIASNFSLKDDERFIFLACTVCVPGPLGVLADWQHFGLVLLEKSNLFPASPAESGVFGVFVKPESSDASLWFLFLSLYVERNM